MNCVKNIKALNMYPHFVRVPLAAVYCTNLFQITSHMSLENICLCELCWIECRPDSLPETDFRLKINFLDSNTVLDTFLCTWKNYYSQ